FGQQVGWLTDMEGARGDEEDMVGLDRPIFGRDRRTLDQRQQVPLYAFARRAALRPALAVGHLVDLVDEDDAVVFNQLNGFALELFLIEQLVGLFGNQRFIGVLDL